MFLISLIVISVIVLIALEVQRQLEIHTDKMC